VLQVKFVDFDFSESHGHRSHGSLYRLVGGEERLRSPGLHDRRKRERRQNGGKRDPIPEISQNSTKKFHSTDGFS